jgi:hypothetical protein
MNPFTIPELVIRIALSNVSAVIRNVVNLRQVCRGFNACLDDKNIIEKREVEFVGVGGSYFRSVSFIIETNIIHGTDITFGTNTYWYEEYMFGFRHGLYIRIRNDGECTREKYWQEKQCYEKRKFIF